MIKNRKVTLKQVAAAANLAVPTVSQILNGRRNYCSGEQIARVRKLADEMGYQPNIGYKIMVGEKTRTVAILFSQERTYHTEENRNLTIRLISELEKTGESVYAVTMGNSREENQQRIRDLINRGCSAFVILGSPVGEESLIRLIEDNGIDYVSANNEYSRNDLRFDYNAVFLKYAGDILKYGARRAAYIMVDKYFQMYCAESAAFLKENGTESILYSIEDCARQPFDCSDLVFEQGYHAVNHALAQGEKAECWIFANDYRALGGMKALQEHGRLGKNIRLYGMNNTRAGRFSIFPVNTSDVMLEEQVSWLLQHLKNTAPEHKILIPEILIRS
mgnify:FL=1